MVDDVITESECGNTSVAFNSTVNTFMDLKKLKLSIDKCSKIHLGKKASVTICPKHKVKGVEMKNSTTTKYLGVYINNEFNAKETITQTTKRGHAVLSQMTSLLNDIPLGKKEDPNGP